MDCHFLFQRHAFNFIRRIVQITFSSSFPLSSCFKLFSVSMNSILNIKKKKTLLHLLCKNLFSNIQEGVEWQGPREHTSLPRPALAKWFFQLCANWQFAWTSFLLLHILALIFRIFHCFNQHFPDCYWSGASFICLSPILVSCSVNYVSLSFCFFFFWQHGSPCRISVPWPRIEPWAFMKAQNPNH